MPASSLALPRDVAAVLRELYTCEFATVNRRGEPITWPAVSYFDEGAGRIGCAVSIAFPVKAYNARRHPQVSLLYSDPTGSSLVDPPAVLVQGICEVEEVLEYAPDIIGLFRAVAIASRTARGSPAIAWSGACSRGTCSNGSRCA